MLNLLLIGHNQVENENYLSNYAHQEQIKPVNIFRFATAGLLSVEEFRDILKLTKRQFSQKTLFVINNFHLCSGIIQNTFLKILEEHQDNLGFVLIARSSSGILETIKSRCHLKVLRSALPKLEEADLQLMEQIIEDCRRNPNLLVTTFLQLGIKNKKEKAATWLNSFIHYGFFHLSKHPHRFWLSQKLKKAIFACSLIEINNLDPELTLDQVFL